MDFPRNSNFWLWIGQTQKNYPRQIISFVRWISYREEGAVHRSFPQTSAFPRAWPDQPHFHLLACLVQGWTHLTLTTPCIIFFFSSLWCLSHSGDARYECSILPVITLEGSKTSQHLGWYWRLGSGTQACTQVSLAAAAAAGFTRMQLRGRARSFLGARATSPFWCWSRVLGAGTEPISAVSVESYTFDVSPTSDYNHAYYSLSLYSMADKPSSFTCFCLISFDFSNVPMGYDFLKNLHFCSKKKKKNWNTLYLLTPFFLMVTTFLSLSCVRTCSNCVR